MRALSLITSLASLITLIFLLGIFMHMPSFVQVPPDSRGIGSRLLLPVLLLFLPLVSFVCSLLLSLKLFKLKNTNKRIGLDYPFTEIC